MNPTPEQVEASAGELLKIIDAYGITYGGDVSDRAKPYSIRVALDGHGTTACCGATPSEAARTACEWLRARGAPLCHSPATAGKEQQLQAVVDELVACKQIELDESPGATVRIEDAAKVYLFHSRFDAAWARARELATPTEGGQRNGD